MRLRGRGLPILLVMSLVPAHVLAAPNSPLVILATTSKRQGRFPVLRIHPDGRRIAGRLDQGFTRRMLRLYRYEQVFLHKRGGAPPAPAYLLLAPSGGFPRIGFYLGTRDKRKTRYVEVSPGTLTGRYGAVDQIFCHEFAHVIHQGLAGEPAPSDSTQVHALGVCTDPVTAFQEGFAEHMQAMVIDDPEADVATKALASDTTEKQRVEARLTEYSQDITAPWAALTPACISFRSWYPQDEQAMRYFAVKENAFARMPAIPERLLNRRKLYAAYLLENILPGAPDAPPNRPPACWPARA